MAARNKYLNNKELLKEIHKSKCSYCEFLEPEYHQFDVVVEDFDEIFDASVQEEARKNKAARLGQQAHQAALTEYSGPASGKPRQIDYKIDPSSLPKEDLVYRVTTYEHIPLDPTRKKNPKKESEYYVKLNFIPFKHYIIVDEEKKEVLEVGRSHTKDGKFCQTHGGMTDRLARMFLLLVERYSQRANWRGYTYVDEMKGQSLLQLSSMGLQFNEAKSNNPFAYYTQALTHSFTRVLNSEKKNQNIRDEILINKGMTPSFSKQIEFEEQVRKMREEAAKGNN